MTVSTLVSTLKGVSARRLRSSGLSAGDHLWPPSYCAISCGGSPLEIIQRYAESQACDANVP